MKRNKIYSFVILLITAFLALIGAAKAEGGWVTKESQCYDHPERALTIHYIIEGKEVNPGDPNAGSWYTLSSSKRYPCTTYYIPESYYNYNTGFGKSQKMFTNEEGTNGVIYWYDNPEFTGSPVMTISYTDIPESREITLYGKTGPIIEVYANGYKKKVVVGKTYSPMTMDPDYYVSTGITHNGAQSVNYWNYSTEADYFAYATEYGERTSNPTYTYYRDRTSVKGGSTMLAMPAQYVHVDNTELIQFINYESCYGNDDYLYCKIADPETGEAMTDKQVQEILNDEYASATVGIHRYSKIPKYYKYFGFIDTQGREYPQEFVMQQEYDGRAFTTIVDGKMSCATDYISPYSSSYEFAKIYHTSVDFDGAEFSGDFNTNYLTKLKSYYGSTFYDNDKTNYQFSSCVPYDLNFKYTYKISNPNARWYTVVIEGTEGTKVTQGSIYKLPDQGKPKAAEVTVVTLKYQDGETPDEQLAYTKTYTPNGFKIDGVHYDFGQEIVVTRDLYITYDYSFELDGPDLPTPTRENYSFKGWYDMTIGGHLITNPKTLEARTLYAQWNDADTVTIVRPDGIPIELEKGSEYTIPEIWDKDEVVNSKVSFNYNDRSGKVDVSEVITYYTKDGVVDSLHNNTHYNCGDKIIANQNMVLVANYIETVKPAKFPEDPERYGHEFLGWFDGVTSTATKYTSYSGNQDLNLFAHWETYIDQISIHYPDYEPYNGATITIDKGQNYTLSNILTDNIDLHDVTFNFNDSGLGGSATPNEVQSVGISKVGNGWFVDGVLYAGGSLITPEEDVWLIEDTIDVEYEPIFPTPADKEWYTFNGWYDEKTGGTKYTSYNVAEEKTFYAHWDEIPSKDIVLEKPSSKSPTYYTVTFDPKNGSSATTSVVTVTYEGSGWTIDGVHYDIGDTVTITKDSVMVPEYIESVTGATFPDNPTKENATFAGWYDIDAEAGGTKYTVYNDKESITLYARYHDIINPFEPGTRSVPLNTEEKDSDVIATVRFVLHNGEDDIVKNVYRRYTPNGWIINGVHYDAGSVVEIPENAVVEPDYIVTIDTVEKPSNPTKSGYEFVGWFDAETGGNQVTVYRGETDKVLHAQYTDNYAILGDSSVFTPRLRNFNELSGYARVFRRLTEAEFNSYTGTKYEVNDPSSPVKIYLCSIYNSDKPIGYYTTADVVFLPENSSNLFKSSYRIDRFDLSGLNASKVKNASHMFEGSSNLRGIDFTNFDTSNVTNMDYMFSSIGNNGYSYSGDLSLDLSTLDTSNVTSMENMFYYSSIVNIDISGFNTSKVTNMRGMFSQTKLSTTINLTGIDTSNVTDMYSMFLQSRDVKNLDLRGFNTSNVTNMNFMFGSMTNLESINLTTFDTSKVENLSTFIYGNSKLTEIDLSTFDTSNVTETRQMFHADNNVQTIYVGLGWNMDKVTSSSNMFTNITSIVGQKGTTYDANHTDVEYAHVDGGVHNPGYLTFKGVKDFYVVHYADGTTEEVLPGTELVLPKNKSTKANDNVADVTFVYNNGNESTVSHVVDTYTANGWLIEGEHYDDSAIYTVNDDVYIDYDYIVTTLGAEFPEDPTKDGYIFDGWYDTLTNGTKYTSYFTKENITLHANYNVDAPVPGRTYTLPINDIPKETDTYTVTFDPQNGTNTSTSTVTVNYTPNGWLVDGVHYSDGDKVIPSLFTQIVRDYSKNITPATYPANPSISGKTFTGWYNRVTGGNKYATYSDEADAVLYAHYTANMGLIPSNVICIRARSLHTDTCESNSPCENAGYSDGDTIYYGQLGTSGELHTGDAFTCDVNGDGDFNEATERFYYVSDYYNTTTKAFETDYATLIYYKDFTNTSYDYNDRDYPGMSSFYDMFTGYGPEEAASYLPSTSQWSNATLFTRSRAILAARGSNFNITSDSVEVEFEYEECMEDEWGYNCWPMTDYRNENFNYPTNFSYSGKAARLLTMKELATATGITSVDGDSNDVTSQPFLLEDNGFSDSNYSEYWLETPYDEGHAFMVGSSGAYTDEFSGSAGIRPVIDVLKDNMEIDLILPETYTVTLPDYTEEVEAGSEFTIPVNKYDKDSDVHATVTFDYQDGRNNTTSYVEIQYLKNGFIADEMIHYDTDEIIIVNSDITLVPDYIESFVGAQFPEPAREGYTFNGWYTLPEGGTRVTSYNGDDDITLYAQWTINIPDVGEEYVLPNNNGVKNPDTFTVTFDSQNGTDTVTSDVIVNYIPNGWLVNGVHKDDGETIIIEDNMTIDGDYNESITSATFPSNPVKDGYLFTGWFDQITGGNKYTSYNKAKNITLYAHYVLASDVTTYTLGVNNQSKADQTIGSVTFKYHNNQADTVSYVIKKFKPKGWLVDGVHYPDGASILKTPETVITRNYGEYIYNASFPDTPTKSGYEFIGWFTEENGGTEVTNLNQEGNLTLHAHWTDSYAYLIDGPAFSTKIVSLGNTSSNYNFRSATAEEFAAKRSSLGTNNVVSTDNSPNTVYVWRDGSNVLMGSDADIIFANPDMSFMFSKYDRVGSESTRQKRLSYSNINVSGINTSKVVNMYAAFFNQTNNNTLNLGNFNTSNVTNLGYAFYFNRNITSFDISGFDTSKVTNMEYAFGGLSKITSLAVENLDVHNVENLKYTLYGLRLVPSLDVAKWDVSNVTSFYGTFLDNPLIETLDLSSWDTSRAETMNFMFGYMNNLESLDVTSFDTSNVTDMELMFAGPNKLTELDLSSFDTSNVMYMRQMFASASLLKKIYVSDKWSIESLTFDTTVNDSHDMFMGLTSIVGQKGTTFNSSQTGKEYAHVDDAPSNPGYLSYKGLARFYTVTLPDYSEDVAEGSAYIIPDNTYYKDDIIHATVTFDYQDGRSKTTSTVRTEYPVNGWTIGSSKYNDGDSIIVNSDITLQPSYVETSYGATFPETPVRPGYTFTGWFTDPDAGQKTTSYNSNRDVTLYAHWSLNLPAVGEEFTLPTNDGVKESQTYTVTFDPKNGDESIASTVTVRYTANGWLVNGEHKDNGETITITRSMTVVPDYIEEITPATFPSSNPTLTNYVFIGWYDAIAGGNKYTSYDKKSNITLYAHYEVSSNAEPYNLGVNNGTKPNVTLGTVTFVYHNNTANTTSTAYKHYKANGWLVDGEHYADNSTILKTSSTVIEPYFSEYVQNAVFPNTKPVKSGYKFVGWFTQETGGEQVLVYNGTQDITLHAQYTDDYAILKKSIFELIDGLVAKNEVLSTYRKATEAEYNSAVNNNVEFIIYSDSSSPKEAYLWRSGDEILYYSTAKVIYMGQYSSFRSSNSTKGIEYLDLSGLNSTMVSSFDYMFQNNDNIKQINLSHFDTTYATSLVCTFCGLHNLESIDLSNLNTSKVTDMHNLFSATESLTELDLSPLDTHNVTNFSAMLAGLGNINNLNLSNLDTSSALNMSEMFRSSKMRYLDLTSFDTSNVTNMQSMFDDSSIEVVDLSSFDTSSLTNARLMFYFMSKLTTIYVGDDWDNTNLSDTYYMFSNDEKLVGYRGTKYHYSNDPKAYAIIDNAPSNPGYLSRKGVAEFYTVTLPDKVDKVPAGSEYVIPKNTYNKENIDLATVTFDYQDNRSNTTSTVQTQYLNNHFKIDGIEYTEGSTYRVFSDITLVPDYTETTVGATFPDEPIKPGYVFEGWFTELNGGEKVTEYTGDTDITLYAHWRSDLPEPGKDFILPTNNIAKSDATFTVTFKLQNGEDDIVSTIGKQYIPNGWVVDGKHRDDGEIIKINADTTIEPDYTEVAIGSFPENPTKEGYQFEKWTDAPQGGNVYTILLINKDITLYAQYLDKRPPHIIPEGTKCIRARKDPHPGSYGTDDTTLSANNAFDCDLNGDGQYNERFYYVSDYYDTETGEFNHDYAVLAYSGLVSYETYYNTQANTNGPVTAVGYLPSTAEWPNVELYKTTRQLRTVNGNSSFDYSVSGVTNLPTINYDGRAARLLTIQEVNEGCGLNIDSGVLTRSQDINNKCSFLLEGLSEEAEEPWDPDIYYEMMYENIIDNSNYYLVLDGDGEEFTYQQDSSEIRPAIEVLKSDLDLAIVPSYYTVTYPNGRVDTASNRELYKLADAMVTKDPDILSTVTFKPQNGDPDVTSNVTKTYVQNEWYISGDHYGGYTAVGNSITVNEDLVVSAPAGAFKSTKHGAVFPQNPTKEGYAFNGWFDAPVGGNVYTSYDGTTNKTLYAQYIKIDAEGKITLSKNETPKANKNYINYEFRAYEMVDDPGTPGEMMKEEYTFHDTYSQKTYSPNGWLVDGVHYDDYDKVLVTSESVITPDYKETIIPGVFPDDYPEDTDGGEFVGWEYNSNLVTSLDFLPNNGRLYATLYPEYTYDYVNLISGSSFNSKLKTMISGSGYNGINLTFREATPTEYNNIKSSLTSANIVSEENYHAAYMWVDAANEVVLYYSEADVIFMNEDSSNMFNNVDELKTVNLSGLSSIKTTNMSGLFSGSDNLSTINLTGINTSKVTNMSNMFSNLPSVTTLSVSGLSTGRVTNMESMFSGDTNLTALDLRSFNTNNVTNMANMFKGDSHLSSIDVTTFNVSSVANMSSMFEGCSSVTSLDLSRFKTDALTNASSMFKGASSLTTIDLHNFKTSSVTNMSSMFEGTTSLTTLNISSFDTSSVTNTSNMFKGDSNLTTVYVSSRWNNEGITSSADMFTGATSIVGQEGTTYSASHTDKEYAVVDKGEERPGYLTFKGVEAFKIYIDNVKVQDAVIGEVFVVPSLANKDSETVSTVTFIYNDGNNTTSTSNVVKTYTPAGYSFNDKKYNPEDIITVEEDIYLTSVYTEENVGATFPTPTRDNYTFVGWIKEQTYDPNGSQTKYTSYDGTEDITLYGAWVASDGYHAVTYDNGDVELVAHGDSITVPTKVSDESETLTFTYTAGTSGSTTTKTFTKDFETFNTVEKYSANNTDYAPGQNIVINSDVFITRSYNGLSYDDTSFEIPNDAYNFIGWFSSETGGKQISTYKEYKENKLTSGNLYGHHNEDGKFTVVLDGVEVGTYNEGSTYTLPEGVNINEDVATVTFINGETTTTAKVHETKTFDYYTVNSFTMIDVIKNVGEELTVNSNIYITSSYKNATLTPVTITDLADTDYEEFAGWYTKQGGEGAKISGSYSDKVDITLYAYFDGKIAKYSFYDNEHQNHIGYKEAKYGTEIDTRDILPVYEVDSEHTITYKLQNGRPQDNYTLNMKATQKIDHWERSTDNKAYALVHTVDVVGPISVHAVFTNELLPKVDLPVLTSDYYPGYDFAGWYDAPVGGKLLTSSDFTEDKDYTVYAHWTRNSDNICTFDDGHTENCPLGETGTIPEEMTTTAAYVNEVANGDLDQYKNYVVNGYILEKTSVVEYFIIDGVKYLPGSTYTIGTNPSITAKYSDEYIEPVKLSTSISERSINNFFDDGETHLFNGWYTERTGGSRVLEYGGAENKDFYAHYKIYNPDAVYYTLRIEHLDGTIDTIENLTQGEKYTLVKDEYVNRDHVIKLYDSDGTTLLGTTTVKFTHTANKWLINGELRNIGSELTILGDTYIKAYETSSNKEVVGYTEPDNSDFIGYFTEVSGGEKVSVNNIKESDNVINTLYAHYKEDVPTGYVQVDFDGDITNVPEGTNITLPTTRTKNGETFDIIFNFNQGSMTSETATVEKTYTVSSYTVNNVAKNPGEVVTANTNLVIRTKYAESYDYSDDTKSYFNITYPSIPTFDMLDLVPDHWVDSMENGNTITNVENIKETTNLYAVYTNQAKVYLNNEVIAIVTVGSKYTLPTNTINKPSDILATVTFNHLNDENTVTTSNRYKLYTPNGWTIGETGYNSGANYLVTEDITLVPRYKETIVEAKMPKDPVKTNANFKGWFTNLEDESTKVTSVDGITEDLTLNALFKDRVKIVDPDTGETEYVDEGTVITLPSLDDKEEKYHNITFKYNYENAPSDKVVRISTQEIFKGWLINGVLHEAGEEITVEEDITKKAYYEKIINNKNLPSDPERDGYTFTGWYNSASELFGSLVDITTITTDTTVYAHWLNFDPETQVKLTWDGEVTIHDIGEEINLVKENTSYDELVATILVLYHNSDYGMEELKVNNHFYVDHLVINGNNHEVSGTYTLNEDTVIRSVYDSVVVYPDLPSVDDDDFIGFYTDTVDGEVVTTLEGINEDTVIHARWNSEHPTTDDEVIVTVDGEISIYSKGDTYNLPDAKTKAATGATITFDPQNGEDVITKVKGTSYTFAGYRLEENNELYNALESFTLEGDMTFTSEFTESNEAPTWPDDPAKENYVFIGWYSAIESGVQVFDFDDIDRNTTLYAHYVKDQEAFITLTNTLTGESVQIVSGSDFKFSESKFNKVNEEKLGKVTYKFNADGYPDQEVEYKIVHTPSGFYVNGDTTELYDINTNYPFSADTSITPYFNEDDDVFNKDVSLSVFDFEVTKGDNLTPKCFSKTNQTDPLDKETYTCYNEYDPEDGNVTVYLHWAPEKDISVTKPDGTVEVYNIYDDYELETNDIVNENNITYNVTLKYNDDVTSDSVLTYSKIYTPNGWTVTGDESGEVHYNDHEVITLEEDIVITPSYTITESNNITLPTNITNDGYNFVGWNKLRNGLGKYYTDSDFENITSSGNITLNAVWTAEELVTIIFDPQNGDDTFTITRRVGDTLGDLTTPKYLGKEFGGWYTDTTYTTEVNKNTLAKYDVTYYARWTQSTIPVVWEEDDPTVFDGTNYVNTEIPLYSDENHEKDYEIGFTIQAYNASGTTKQGVFVNAKYENSAAKYPGLVFRKKDNVNNTVELTQTLNNTRAAELFTDLTYPYKVRIVRDSKAIYYSINDSELVKLQNAITMNQDQIHDVETWFGAAADENGAPFRYVKATLSDMYVRLGHIPDADEVTVTYPDGTVELKHIGDTVDLGNLDEIIKPDYRVATITFKYQDEATDDEYAYVYKTFTQNGWAVTGETNNTTNYAPDGVITLTESISILPNYITSYYSDLFPADPERENYTFKGWVDGVGNTYNSYLVDEDITLYANWEEDLVIPVPGKDDPIIVPKGTTINLPENDNAKDSTNLSAVTFKPENGDQDIISYVKTGYTPNGWLIDGVHYDNGDEYTVTEVPDLVPDFVSYIVPAEFPEDPAKTDKDFNGWYTLAEGGEKVTEYSDGENDITLYAQYIDHVPVIITPDGPVHPNDDGTYTFKENTVNKDEELLSTVTFVYHNGDSDSYSYVVKEYIKNGWIAEGTHYNAGDTITVDHDIEIIPDYTESIRPAVFPSDPTVDGDTFTGWFSEKTGGTRYTAYSGSEDITLHAQWENGTDINPTVLCRRARTLHTETCERTGTTVGCNKLGYAYGDTITYGSLGNGNTLARGDAFTCDVNGDGVFDEEHERFYYVNDNYSILTQTYDHDYAVMLYYGNLFDLGMINNGAIAYSTGSGDRGPNNIKTYLPTTAEWSNTSLKENIRYIYDYDYSAQDYFEVDYTGYAARLAAFKEVAYDLNGNNDDQNVILFENTQFAKQQDSNGHPQYTYYLESSSDRYTSYISTTHFNGGSGRITAADPQIGLRPVIDVPKDRIQLVDDTYTVSIDGEVVETLRAGTIYTIPENTKAKASDTYTVTFNYHNESPETTSNVEVSYLPNGYDVTDNHYNGGEKVVITGNISLTSDYIETVIPATFPEDPTKEDETFNGWFDQETGGNKYTEYSQKADITLHAQWIGEGPTAIDVESNALVLVKGEEKQIEVITTPEGLENVEYTYTITEGGNDIVSVSDQGVITATGEGTTTIEIAVKDNPSVNTLISVTVYDNEITSETLDVKTKDLTGEDIKIIIGAEPKTSIKDFLDYIDNPQEFLEVYNKDNELVSSDDYEDVLITTGSKVKLVIDNHEYDNVLVIIRGDLDEDGLVNVLDKTVIQNHILNKERITNYIVYAADIVEEDGATIDNAINVLDKTELNSYILNKITSLNEKDGE